MALPKDYRVRLINDCPGINPEFDPKQDVGPDNKRFVTVKQGTELTGPHVWMLCRPDAYFEDVKAEPIDEITRKKVAQDARRSAAIIKARNDRIAADELARTKRRSR